MSSLKVEVIGEHRCQLAEGPVWDAKRNAICWIDLLLGEIHEYSFHDQSRKVYYAEQIIGSFAICDNGNFITALKNGFAFIERPRGEIKMISSPEEHLPNNRFNDGKCDPVGRFWAGTMSLTEDTGTGSLYVLEKDLTHSKKVGDITISNGISWSIDHKQLFYIDTPSMKVSAFDYDKVTGRISNRRTVIQIEDRDGYPDGMTIDNEGMLWIAHWNGWQVTRWNPVNGEKLFTIKLPVAKVTSCIFGGENLSDLFITSAQVGLTPEELQEQPLAGSLFVIRDCGFTGMPSFEFIVEPFKFLIL